MFLTRNHPNSIMSLLVQATLECTHMYVNFGLYAHTLCANFGLNEHTLYANFGLYAHTLCANFGLNDHAHYANFVGPQICFLDI